MKKLCFLGYPKCSKWRFWSDCANAQADLSVSWAHILGSTFSDCAARLKEHHGFHWLTMFPEMWRGTSIVISLGTKSVFWPHLLDVFIHSAMLRCVVWKKKKKKKKKKTGLGLLQSCHLLGWCIAWTNGPCEEIFPQFCPFSYIFHMIKRLVCTSQDITNWFKWRNISRVMPLGTFFANFIFL